jgi:hypothetical protein
MGPISLLRGLLGLAHPAESPPEPTAPEERRRPALRCNYCKTWTQRLVYLSNGGHYCEPCAVAVYGWSRARPAGRRADDLALDGIPDHRTPVEQ